MSFLAPEYFWLLLFLLPVFIQKNFGTLRITAFGYMFTFLFIVLALARPVFPLQPIVKEEVLSDVVVAVDLSYSMQAKDVAPNRLGFAKECLEKLVKTQTKSRFGVLGFTTNAIVLSPLTSDSELLLHLFGALDEKLIITKGSAVMPALELAGRISGSKTPTLLLLSDGGDEESYAQEAAFAKERGLVVNILMIATDFGTTLELQGGELLKDELGNLVVSRANEAISLIAKESGGVYSRDFGEILEALELQKNKDFKAKSTIINNYELFYYFVFLALLTFLLSVTRLKRYVLVFLLLFGVHVQGGVLEFFEEPNRVAFQEANGYYKAGEYEKALQKYESIKSSSAAFKALVFYNKANTLVRLKEFEKARESYLKSLTLGYSREADENMHFIQDAKEEEQMNAKQQKTDKKSSLAKKQDSSQKEKTKEGGSSNMKVSASAGSGESKSDKKTASQNILNLNQGKAKLSSKQYELINKRQIDEKKPY